MHVQEMYRRLTGLVVFRRLLQDPVVAACGEMLSARVRGDSGDFSAACAGFEAALFQSSDSWSCYLRETVLESENVCIRGQAVGRSSVLQESLRREREKVIANTRALLEGKPANNVLLYGDAGTGKSSAIKAIANAFADQGLRLVEVKKNQLYQIPDLMDALASNPLKFILFIDDLSFTANDDNFAALKAILEGSVGGRAGNIAVYATSNRRHLIKETLTDREGDDIHESDTRQELMSLSARFGLTITFGSPDRERYLHIVEELAKQYGVELDPRQLAVRSEAFAVRSGGRSARVAKQFIELCKAGVFS